MEKERIYRENISRVIQNKKRDAVGIVDNRLNTNYLNAAPVQRVPVDAGLGGNWHIHKDHIKFSSNQSTRVDFRGRSVNVIFNDVSDLKVNYATLLQGNGQKMCWNDCMRYLRHQYGDGRFNTLKV
ncbi:MAG: hypothetical protein K5874_10735 [Bacteroidaceae bacterium]|nr:hypothetical protein [Bacteroidaceae bacterium]